MEERITEDALVFSRGHRLRQASCPALVDPQFTPRSLDACEVCLQELDAGVSRHLQATTAAALQEIIATSNSYQGIALPAVVVYAGINTADHDELFAHIARQLTASIASCTIRLTSEDCPTVEAALGNVMHRLPFVRTSNADSSSHQSSSTNSPDATCGTTMSARSRRSSTAAATKASNFTEALRTHGKSQGIFQSCKREDVPFIHSRIAAWYDAAVRQQENVGGGKHVTIVLDDADVIPAGVLEALVGVFHQLRSTVPCLFILGSSTSPNLFLRSLSRRITNRLSITGIQLEGSVSVLDSLVEELIIDGNCPVRFSQRSIDFLTEHFLQNTLSVKAFARSFRLLLIEHFSATHASAICMSTSNVLFFATKIDMDRPSLRDQVPPCAFQGAAAQRLWNSCHLLAHSLPRAEAAALTKLKSMKDATLETGENPYNFLGRCIFQLHSHQLCSKAVLSSVLRLMKELGVATPSLRQAWLEFMGHGVKSQLYLKILNRVKVSTDAELRRAMAAVTEQLASSTKSVFVLQYEHKFKVATLFPDLMRTAKRCLTTEEAESPTPSLAATLHSVNTRSWSAAKRRRVLLATASSHSAAAHPLGKAREAVKAWIDAAVSQHLAPPTHLPLHEALVLANESVLRRHFDAKPRAAVLQALAQPAKYLPDLAASTQGVDGPTREMPSVSILFNIVQSFGRLVNLHDVFEQYKEVYFPGTTGNKKKKGSSRRRARKAEPDPPDGKEPENIDPKRLEWVKASFVVGIKELVRIGVVKQTSRKEDHLARVIYDIAWQPTASDFVF